MGKSPERLQLSKNTLLTITNYLIMGRVLNSKIENDYPETKGNTSSNDDSDESEYTSDDFDIGTEQDIDAGTW